MVKRKKSNDTEKATGPNSILKSMSGEFQELRMWLSNQFGRVGERFERIETRLEHLETDSRDLKEGLRRVEHDASEIKDEMQAMSRAVDKDAETIVEYGRRIKKLEHAR